MALNLPPRGASKYRVLASAYAAEPGKGSEPGIGWNWARQIALHHELTLVTRRNNVDAIRRAAAAEDLRMNVVGHDLPASIMRLKKGERGAMPYYYLWQKSLGKVGAALMEKAPYDVAHHITFASGWIPSGLAKLDLPFVFGPVGQHPKIPAGFQGSRNLRARIGNQLREGTRRAVPKLDPAVDATWKAADVILSLGSAFGNRIPERLADRVIPCLACGIHKDSLSEPTPRAADEPLRVVFSGRLVNLKGVHMALDAFALAATEINATMEILGEGPERLNLEESIRRRGLADHVTLRGHLNHDEALAAMRRAHVFLFPSFEGAGMVVPEAMAAGAAVLCLAFGGPGEMTSGGRGVHVPLESTPAETASELSVHLQRLYADDSARLRIAEVGLEWARREATWEAKGLALGDIYGLAIRSARLRGNRQEAA